MVYINGVRVTGSTTTSGPIAKATASGSFASQLAIIAICFIIYHYSHSFFLRLFSSCTTNLFFFIVIIVRLFVQFILEQWQQPPAPNHSLEGLMTFVFTTEPFQVLRSVLVFFFLSFKFILSKLTTNKTQPTHLGGVHVQLRSPLTLYRIKSVPK